MTKNASWLAIVAVALAASGCSELMAQSKSKPAKPAYGSTTSAQYCESDQHDCEIRVKVDTSQSPCALAIEPSVNVVLKAHNVHIVWTLDAPDNYKLVYLRFKDQETKYQVQFASRLTIPSKDQFYDWKVGTRQAEVKDKNTKNGAWYYEVEVTNGTDTCKLDPPMVNG